MLKKETQNNLEKETQNNLSIDTISLEIISRVRIGNYGMKTIRGLT